MIRVIIEWFSDKGKSLFVFLALIPLYSYSQDADHPNQFVLSGYVKDMPSFLFTNANNGLTSSNLIHNRLNLKWFISSSFTASVGLRNRLLTGNILTTYPGYNQTFETDQGIVGLSKNLIDQKSLLLNTSIDRIWLQYSTKKFQVTAGRQRINWGQTFVWNPNDIFNSYSYFDFDYEEKPGGDAIRLQYYSGSTSVIEFAIKSDYLKRTTFAGLYRFNKWNYDFQFLGGIANQTDFVIGTGWSGQILKGGFRGEATYFHPTNNANDTTGVFVMSVGYDYTFKNSLFLQLEVLYNGNRQQANSFMLNPLSGENMSAKNLFLPDFSMFGSVSYPVTPLVNCSLAAIVNQYSKMYFLIPGVNISMTENLELAFTAQLMRSGKKLTSDQNLNIIYARLKYSF